jgi:hypothetical protein
MSATCAHRMLRRFSPVDGRLARLAKASPSALRFIMPIDKRLFGHTRLRRTFSQNAERDAWRGNFFVWDFLRRVKWRTVIGRLDNPAAGHLQQGKYEITPLVPCMQLSLASTKTQNFASSRHATEVPLKAHISEQIMSDFGDDGGGEGL